MEHADKASPTENTDQHNTKANHNWNADMGASSHMMPHQHWIQNYQLKQIPIRLADDTTIYSEGVGSMLFEPQISRKFGKTVVLYRVLHTLKIQNNLLSIINLT